MLDTALGEVKEVLMSTCPHREQTSGKVLFGVGLSLVRTLAHIACRCTVYARSSNALKCRRSNSLEY
jgi:hypothetical protein